MSTAGSGIQRYDLAIGGSHHRVEVEGSVARTVRWYADGDLVATRRSSDDKLVLEPDPDLGGERGQAVGLVFGVRGHARRVTLFDAEGEVPAQARAVLGTGGVDLDPEPGSPAAQREQRIREHPWRHAAVATAGGVAKVVVPLLLGLLAVNLALRLPWPSGDVPWPDIDLPRIPWPDVPWPDIDRPDWRAPAWARRVADALGYVWPVVVALLLARGEVRRRRKQDALKAALRAQQEQERATRRVSSEDGGSEQPPATSA